VGWGLACFLFGLFLEGFEAVIVLVAPHLGPEITHVPCHEAVVVFSSGFLACDSHCWLKRHDSLHQARKVSLFFLPFS
jgi:hypothetical protein